MSAPASPARAGPALWLSLGACAAAAFWISEGVAPWDGDVRNAWHHYEYLAEGFAHGHTYLSVALDPRLLALRDPYDPWANEAYRYWDASLYRGKYYLYFGPVPALFMAAGRILTGLMIPQRLAVASFATAGMAALALLLREIRRRHFPGLSPAALAGILFVAFNASWLPVALRRSAVWELPIVAAAACLWWAIYFLWRFHDSGGRARWAAAAGVAVALLMGSRVTCLFSAAAVTLLFLVPVAGPGTEATRRWGMASITAALAFAGGCALLLYNHERFGGWLDFGDSYQMRGFDERAIAHFSPGYVPFNAHAYLLSLPEFSPYFPFLHPFWTDDTPPGHLGSEEIYGVLFMMPVQLAALAAFSWAWRGRGAAENRPVSIVIAAAGCASAMSALILFSFAGACSRYIVEMAGGSTVASSIGLMAVFGSAEGPRLGRRVRLLAAAASCWTVGCVWLASADFRGFMRETNPGTYHALAHALDYPSAWWARWRQVRFGPVEMDVRVPRPAGSGRTVLVAAGRPLFVDHLVLEQAGGGEARLALEVNLRRVLETPELAVPGGRLHVRLRAPWLYPPADSPYWDEVADPASRLDRQTLYSLQWDTGRAEAHSALSADATAFVPAVRGPGAPDAPFVESLRPEAQAP